MRRFSNSTMLPFNIFEYSTWICGFSSNMNESRSDILQVVRACIDKKSTRIFLKIFSSSKLSETDRISSLDISISSWRAELKSAHLLLSSYTSAWPPSNPPTWNTFKDFNRILYHRNEIWIYFFKKSFTQHTDHKQASQAMREKKTGLTLPHQTRTIIWIPPPSSL